MQFHDLKIKYVTILCRGPDDKWPSITAFVSLLSKLNIPAAAHPSSLAGRYHIGRLIDVIDRYWHISVIIDLPKPPNFSHPVPQVSSAGRPTHLMCFIEGKAQPRSSMLSPDPPIVSPNNFRPIGLELQ